MHLTPAERERLLLAAAADLARRRLARGARLGATEAIALVCDEAQEMAWDGVDAAEVVERCRGLVDPDRLLPGVAGAVPHLQVEALFDHGTTLLDVPAPFGPPSGAGEVLSGEEPVELAPGRRRAAATLVNTGPLVVWVSSHVPLDRLNPAVTVATPAGRWRVDVPAGSAVRLDPGAERDVGVVEIAQPATDPAREPS